VGKQFSSCTAACRLGCCHFVQRFASAGPPEMQKHAVDMHLGRHSRALRHLMSLQPPRFDAALALARDKVTRTGSVSFAY
jgi:hypothetical protein